MILLFVAMPVTSTLYLILEEEGSALGVAVDFLAMVIVAALLLFVIPLPPVMYRHGPSLFCRGWPGRRTEARNSRKVWSDESTRYEVIIGNSQRNAAVAAAQPNPASTAPAPAFIDRGRKLMAFPFFFRIVHFETT